MAAHSKLQLEPVCTYQDIADELGVSKERIRQIERKALHKLRVALVVRGHSFEMVQGFERESVLEPRNEVSVAP